MNATETKARLLKRFHTLCTKAQMDNEEKYAIVYSFGVESSRKLTAGQLAEACQAVEKLVPHEEASMDQLRKRLIAAIGGWLTMVSQNDSIGMIKAVACRAAKKENFK